MILWLSVRHRLMIDVEPQGNSQEAKVAVRCPLIKQL